MKRVTGSLIMILIACSSFGQYPGMGTPGKMGMGGKAMPMIGHVYGKLVDASSKPIPDVSVVLLQNKFDTVTKKRKQILLKGIVTKANGDFSFEELPAFGPLLLKITASGFKPIDQTVTFTPGNFDKDLGNMKMVTDVQQLSGVTVTASSTKLRMDIDKKVFSVDKNIVSAGGTALDVMKNVPSVQVDIDGNVKLRNAAPQIFIEGRPTTLSLDQIPADAIESVEVITNPSAKYDASGGNAGILNIVLKKNRKTGYNGNVRAGVDRRGGVNAGGDFNVRQGKINASASAMVNQMHGVTNGTTDQQNLFENPARIIHQDDLNKNNGAFIFGKAGLDYFVTNRTTLSLNGIKVHGEFKPTDVINSSIQSNGGQSYASRNSNSTRSFNANGVQFGMKHLFPKDGMELTADGNYFSGKNGGSSFYITDSMNSAHNIYSTEQQQVISTGDNQFLTLQSDFTTPLKGKSKFETGVRANIRKLTNLNETQINYNSAGFIKIPSATSNYSNTDNVYAAYATYTSAIKSFGYQLGLRGESSDYKGDLLSAGDKFAHTYPISLFPSLFLSEKFKGEQQVQLNYSRRINRPNFFQFIPYTDRTDPLNITRGNPNLVPEFTNSLEASYSKSFNKNNNILASVYYKGTTNLITRFQQQEMDPVLNKQVLVNTYVNANSSYSYGAELTSINYINKWWDITSNLNIYNSKINVNNISGSSQPSLVSAFGKVNNNFKLPKNYTIQLSGNFQSKSNLPVNSGGDRMGGGGPFGGGSQSSSQGYIKGSYGVDVAFKKTFLKNNAAALTLNLSDIFRSRIQQQYSTSPYFIQTTSRLRDPQMVRLNFSYRFGNLDMSLFKRKNMKGEAEGAQGAMQTAQ
ncbi:MAG: outer membrane beta-barrel family protein [Ginsengibacter sp.]